MISNEKMKLISFCHTKFCQNRMFRPRFLYFGGFNTPCACGGGKRKNDAGQQPKILQWNKHMLIHMTRKINFKHFSHTDLSRIRPPSCRFIKKSVLNGARMCFHFSVNSNFEWFRKQAGFDKTGQNVFELYVIILLSIYQLVRAVS